ncbi:hypothetical protein [Brevundimonas lenta]|uniref:Lipoprotein n=1 Tax=Brevundimonas lenta TaxID=424796 RepID=A0A7W6JF26_9CAUL|nr:hypothetical protein [Brevundimonas lenta]MBB4083934.1 hypothetical protein [Brevundimonas lenta]
MIRALIVAALAAPLLAGCVIYADDGGEKDVIVRVSDTAAAPTLETVRSARIEGDRLVVRVESNGCTDVTDFAVDVTPASDGVTEVALRRTDVDMCRAIVAEGVEVSWTLSDLGLESGAQARLMNPLKL